MKYYLSYRGHYYALAPERRYELSAQPTADISLPLNQSYLLTVTADGVFCDDRSYTEAGVHEIQLEQVVFQLLALNQGASYWITEGLLYVSSLPQASIQLIMQGELTVQRVDDIYYQVWTDRPLVLNGRTQEGTFQAQVGDYLFIEGHHVLQFRPHHVDIWSTNPIASQLEPVAPEEHARAQRAADYHRSPRIIHQEPEDKVTILAPPTEDEQSSQSIWRSIAMPLAMIGMTSLMYFLSAGRGMMYFMVGMSGVSIVMSIHQYFAEKRKFRAKQARKIATYREYLDTKYQELSRMADQQRQARDYHYPAGQSLVDMARQVDRRLYEKSANAFDFLAYSLGQGDVKPGFEVRYQAAELSHYNQEVATEARTLVDAYQQLKRLPVPNSLSFGPVGYIGNRQVALEQVQQAIMQLATFHSYHDLQFIVVGPEEEQARWHWMRWLPHSTLAALHTKGFVFNQASRDRLMTSFYQIIKDRKLQADTQAEGNKHLLFLPHYVLVLTDMTMVQDHLISEFLQEDLSQLGISLLLVENVMESLPDHVRTVLHCADARKAELILQNGVYRQQHLVPHPALDEQVKEQFARYLSSIRHVLTMKNALPDSVSFLTMYGAKRTSDLQVLDRWTHHHAYQTLAVPIGYRGRDDLLQLDLHEQAHGPHGLIAGTTGSGKSELIQTYILSLAVNYHPYEVAFLLIDYKGGGMANLFQSLPHVVGIITNLEAAQANRALVSIRAELLKRQRLFSEHGLNHINQYHKLRQQDVSLEPMPHLFLISDEFAELKAEQPDFMNELISIARVGRSLGVHLILATQKPSGVVNDQIWSNARFKIALKVQDVSDSREVLHTADAATLTQVGRAYLQVGNNEIYELFQSAWSGAPYQGDRDEQPVTEALTLYEIEESGQLRAINQDLSGLDYQETIESSQTELDAVVADVASTFAASGVAKVAQPWLPPLGERIHHSVATIGDIIECWGMNSRRLQAMVGRVDLPHEQKQEDLTLDIGGTGHLALVGSPGFGKSTFLHTLALALMRRYSPAQVQFYLLDFGTGGLFPLQDYPHVGDLISLDDEVKAIKWLNWMERMLATRRELFTQAHVANIEQYNLLEQQALPTVMILVDSIDGLVESKLKERVEAVLTKIAREGISLGVQLVISASRWHAIRMQMQSSIKTKIVLYLFDKSDMTAAVGRTDLQLGPIPGRGIINYGKLSEFQVYTPFESDDFANYSRFMREEATQMSLIWHGVKPYSIPMLPKHVTPTYLAEQGWQVDRDLIIGVNHETGEPERVKIAEAMLLVSDNPLIVENYLVALDFNISTYYPTYSTVILDGQGVVSGQLFAGARSITGARDVTNAMIGIIEDLKERISDPKTQRKAWFILLTDVVTLVTQGVLSEANLRLLLQEGPKHGIVPIFVGMDKHLINGTSNQVKLLKQLVKQIVIGIRRNDQSLVRLPQYISMEPDLLPNQSFVLRNQNFELVQLLEGGKNNGEEQSS